MTISILSQPCCCILATDIVRKQCQKLCKYFSTFFSTLYNTCVTTLNIDQTIHLLSLSLSNISSININKEDYIIDPQNIDKSRTLSQIEK